MPQPARMPGSDPGYPKTSGSQQPRGRFPNSAWKKAMPCRTWRINDSPEGTLQSASTHMPPVHSQRPDLIQPRISSYSDGKCFLVYA